MELKELTEKVLAILEIKNIDDISKKLFDISIKNENKIYEEFGNIVDHDLSKDWLQMIYQYYLSDRKEKKQDYTPISLARLAGRLAGDSECVIDMCAGSGALTIQKWNLNSDKKFLLYESDKNVIPFLIFNMALRNIKCVIVWSDILTQEVFKTYSITKGEKFGQVKEENNELHAYF